MPGLGRITWTDLDKLGLPEKTSAVVNLAGQNVLDPARRWSAGFKQNVACTIFKQFGASSSQFCFLGMELTNQLDLTNSPSH